MPFVDLSLDERALRHASLSYHTVAGGVGTHLRPLLIWPEIQRYVDVPIDLGFDLGGLKKDSHLEGRGDFYIAAAIDVYAPDVGPIRYLDSGVPGVRVGVRYTTYVLGWESDTTFEIGLIWRWGVPIDLYRHWETRRTGD